MITSLLIANRGEIACRIIRTCRQMGIRTVAVYSDADRQARHVRLADEAIHIGPAAAADSYLRIGSLLSAARRSAVAAIHPGYGFLAENPDFAHACQEAGFIFIGPPAQAIRLLGDKSTARRLAASQGLTVIPGPLESGQPDASLTAAAREMGYPLLVKAAAGGGGKGMRLVRDAQELPEALTAARHEAQHAFGSDDLLLEKVIPAARHIEVQVLGDKHGHLVHLGERECSMQRRYQKIIEESPSPVVGPQLRLQMGQAALAVAAAAGYENAGTVEFLLDGDGRFYFLEMNTRLQVEHPVTEMVTSIDLVEWQIRVAEGQTLPWSQEELDFTGHAVEARIYAENPAKGFLPATGKILYWREPQGTGVRVESGIQPGDQVTAYYDPLLVKIIAHGPDRQTAVRLLTGALQRTVLLGINNNLPFLLDLLRHPDFLSGAVHTRLVEENLAGWQEPDRDFSLAYLAAALAQYSQQTPGGYWRNNPNSPLRYRFTRPGQENVVEVLLQPDQRSPGRFQLSLSTAAEEIWDIELDDYEAPEMVMIIDGYRQRVTAVSSEADWWVQTRQGAFQFQAVPLLPRSHRTAGAGGSLRAPMPGTVMEILVEVGQRVEEGQALMKLEAMKMEHTIRSDAAGIIGAIFFAPGDIVDADTLLIAIEEL